MPSQPGQPHEDSPRLREPGAVLLPDLGLLSTMSVNWYAIVSQRRKEQVGEDGRGHPGHDDDPAEADGEPPGRGEERVHVGSPRWSGGTRDGAGGWQRRSWCGRRRVDERRRRAEADDLMTAQCLKKWLKTAADQASQDRAIGLDLADTRRPLDLPAGSGADETDLYPAYRQLFSHAHHARNAPAGPTSVELPV